MFVRADIFLSGPKAIASVRLKRRLYRILIDIAGDQATTAEFGNNVLFRKISIGIRSENVCDSSGKFSGNS